MAKCTLSLLTSIPSGWKYTLLVAAPQQLRTIDKLQLSLNQQFFVQVLHYTTTGISPAQLMMGHQLRSQLDLLLPNIADKVQCNQNLQKQTHDYHARDRQLQIDDLVSAKNYGQGHPGFLERYSNSQVQ